MTMTSHPVDVKDLSRPLDPKLLKEISDGVITREATILM